jgi:hypothetical protein
MLHEFIRAHRSEILKRTKARVARRPAPPSPAEELGSGIPLFLDELVEMLRNDHPSTAVIDDHAKRHGKSRFAAGFTLTQVVHDYGDVCQVVTELAIERKAAVTTEEFRRLNQCLDDAIAGAVTEFGRMGDAAQSEANSDGAEALSAGMRVHLDRACAAFEIIRGGRVSAGGSTGAVLSNSLSRMKELLARKAADSTTDGEVPLQNRPS